MVNYVHGRYASVHEGDMFRIFENGELVNEYFKWLNKEEIEKIQKERDDLPF